MSIPVELAALRDHVLRCGSGALLVTTATGGAPHVASVVVSFDGSALAMRVGNTTRANAAEHPAVALVWAAGPTEGHCLIVDAVARATPTPSHTLVVEPTSAVLHRLAGAPTGS